MEHKIVGLIAAMPGEIRPLLKIAGKYSKTKIGEFNLYSFSVKGRECRLLESGIGIRRAARAAQTLISDVRPGLIISFGFGGAVLPGMAAGDLAVAERTSLWRETSSDIGETIELSIPASVLPTLKNIGIKLGFSARQADFITSGNILNKKELTGFLPGYATNPVLDMETWAIVRETIAGNIPLLAIRAVSDAADEELDFSLDLFTDHEMNIRISRILLAIARKPGLLPQLIRLAGNSRVAGRNLAFALRGLLENDSLTGAQIRQ
ncbi:MAG TPA: nucleoside phosphorylase [Geobacteraceae bacterium]|nr:nucleoside phosphorylase [Geobacteraceae bacterium]